MTPTASPETGQPDTETREGIGTRLEADKTTPLFTPTAKPSRLVSQFVGVLGTNGARGAIERNGSWFRTLGLNSNSLPAQTLDVSGDFRKHLAFNRSSSTVQTAYYGATITADTDTSVAAPNEPWAVLARRHSGGWDTLSDANLGFAAIGQSLTSGEWSTFFGLIDTFQSNLSRANP